MSTDSRSIVLWNASDQVSIPAAVSKPDEIVQFAAPTLSPRDMKSIVSGFESESFEMVSTFVWTKAAATMKKQLSSLGMEFVGEMLGRPDLTEDSDPATSIGDHEAIGLAEDLGMITSIQGLRLKHSLELVTHFANLEHEAGEEEMMEREEAISLLKTCITSILGKPRFETAVRFADFRRALGERSLKGGDGDVESIAASPYFFVRTTVSVLLSMVKGSKGAILEHAVGNTIQLVPTLWGRLRAPERWQIGQAYAEVNASGNRLATSGLKKALIEVHGFDYVPESLRSNTFTEAASRVLSAHFGLNNYYNEQAPMFSLASLGTAIPRPAFAKCMEATLAVWLGNRWGNSWGAESDAAKVLDSIRPEQWEYYLSDCLFRDRTVLDKVASDSRPLKRWRDLVRKYSLGAVRVREQAVKLLITSSAGEENSDQSVASRARSIREQIVR